MKMSQITLAESPPVARWRAFSAKFLGAQVRRQGELVREVGVQV